jgi:hypothetical protein
MRTITTTPDGYLVVDDRTLNQRYSLPPDSDLSGQPEDVRERAATTWTPAIVQAYRNTLAASSETALVAAISARQIRLWLINHGIPLAAVQAAIDAIPDPSVRDATAVEWEYAPYVERSHPMLMPLGNALGLSEADIDKAFEEAAQL